MHQSNAAPSYILTATPFEVSKWVLKSVTDSSRLTSISRTLLTHKLRIAGQVKIAWCLLQSVNTPRAILSNRCHLMRRALSGIDLVQMRHKKYHTLGNTVQLPDVQSGLITFSKLQDFPNMYDVFTEYLPSLERAKPDNQFEYAC